MANVLSSILMLLIVSRINNLDITKTESLSEGKVNLLGDNNLYLARCNSCGTGSYPDSAGVHASRADDPWAIWTVQVVGSKVAFKSDTGKYLGRCYNCWNDATYLDSAFVHVSSISNSPYALWTPQKLSNGKWAFKGDNGKYLARCYNCVKGAKYTDFAFVHSNTPNGNLWSQWTVNDLI